MEVDSAEAFLIRFLTNLSLFVTRIARYTIKYNISRRSILSYTFLSICAFVSYLNAFSFVHVFLNLCPQI